MEDGDTQYCTSFSPLQLNLRDVAQTKGGMAEFLHQWCSSKDQYGTRLVGWLVGWLVGQLWSTDLLDGLI